MKLCLLVMSEATLTMSYQYDLSSSCKAHFKKPCVLAGTCNPIRDRGDRHASWDSLVGLVGGGSEDLGTFFIFASVSFIAVGLFVYILLN